MKQLTNSQKRTQYGNSVEENYRSFGSYLSEIKFDIDAVNIELLKKELKELKDSCKKATEEAEKARLKQKADSLTKRIEAIAKKMQDASYITGRLKKAREAFSGMNVSRADICPLFLKTYLPEAVDSFGNICDIKKVDISEEIDTLKFAEETGLETKRIEGILVLLKPIRVWTANKLLTKFSKAVTAREKQKRQADQLTKEAEKKEKQRKRIEAMRLQVEAYDKANKPEATEATEATE